MHTLHHRHGCDGDKDANFDRKRDRKERRRLERQEKKRARIESHERWVEQRRLMKEKRREKLDSCQQQRSGARRRKPQSVNEKVTSLPSVRERGSPALERKALGVSFSDWESLPQQRDGKDSPAAQKETKSAIAPFTTNATAGVSPVASETTPAKYTPPMLRKTLVNEKNTALDECIRRIINKLTVRNVADMTKEVSELFGGGIVKGSTRASVLRSLTQHTNRICMLDTGPLTPIVSLPFAGLIRGLQLLHGNVVGAELVEGLCLALQEHLQKNNETSASNGAMVLAHLYILNAVDSLLVSTFLRSVLKTESHSAVCAAACGLTFLRLCGEKLLKEAPGQMEQMLVEAKACTREHQDNNRYRALFSYITEIVTGRTRSARRTMKEEDVPVESLLSDIATLLPGGNATGNKRALNRIMSTANVLTGLTWEHMLCTNKPPRWFAIGGWVFGDSNEDPNESHKSGADGERSSFTNSMADSTDESDSEVDLKAERIRQIRQEEKAISAQRLNTENKREIFRCITSASDDLEAFRLLMHRDSSFSRLHDTLAVLVQCVYQEKVYNSYYSQILQRFCSAKASCKVTLQFVIWDLFKMIRVEGVDVTGYFNLSCLLAHFIEGGIFTLSVLRGLDLESTNRTIGLFTRILLLRILLQLSSTRLVEVFFGGDGLTAHDVKIETGVLRLNLALFIERYFVDEREAGKWIPHFYDVVAAGTSFDMRSKDGDNKDDFDGDTRIQHFLKRVKIVLKALKSGIL